MIRLTDLRMGAMELAALHDVCASGALAQGQRVAAFERAVADYLHLPHAAAVSSGTAALHLALLALGVGPGDDVLVPAFAFPGTGNAVEQVGARTVLTDVLPDTYNVDPTDLGGRVTPRTRAIVPVHLFGQACAMDEVAALAQRYNLAIVEDASSALGATWDRTFCGGFGDASAYNFGSRNVITTGEGGMVAVCEAALDHRVRTLRNNGLPPDVSDLHPDDDPAPDVIAFGLNYRMTDLQAAMGCIQLAQIEGFIGRRRMLAARYDEALVDLDWLKTPVVAAKAGPTYQAYVVRLSDGVDRARLLAYLHEKDIEANRGSYALHTLTAFRERDRVSAADYPVADALARQTVALPLHPWLYDEDIDRVIETLFAFMP